MKTINQSSTRSRTEVVADMNDVSRAVAGKITEKRRMLKSGKTVVYHQLQQWVDGKNVTTHIPQKCLKAFTEAVDGHEKLRSLISELSSVDTKAIIEDPAVKKTNEIIGHYSGKIAATVSHAAESILCDGLGGTFDLENKLHKDAVGMCRELLELLLSIDDSEIPGNEAVDGEYYAGKRAKTIKTLFGDIRCESRDYYYNRKNNTGRYPFDDVLGLINGSTPALVARAVRHTVKEPYAEAASDFQSCMSRHMTADIMMTYPRALGEKAERFLGERLSPDKFTPECAYVLADGTGLPLRRKELKGVKGKGPGGRAKTREAKVGAIFTGHPTPDAPEERARDPGSTTYVATIERKDAFAKQLRAEFDRRFTAMPEVTLFIADGAPWLWNIRRTHFPFAVEILDFYHAAEHLEPIIDQAGYKDKDKKRIFKKWRKWLKQGKVAQLIRVADDLVGKTKEGKKAIGYFKNNKERMKYNEYLAKGWFIGSGVVESGCKTVIGKRFKQSGMIWSKNGLRALFPFRIAYMSGRYDELWQYLLSNEKQVKVI